jgi:GntR family transcriptional regulator, carbon starvation induced regulator
MAATKGATSRSESVYLYLRQRLMRGEFGPNHRLKLSDLCAESGTSVSVVREALTRLAEQGLIQFEPNRGFFVRFATIDEVNDLAFIRAQIEGLAIRLAVGRGGPAWEASVVAAHHELTLTPFVMTSIDPAANEEWSRVHSAFHSACASACGSPRLIAMRARLFDEGEVLRQMLEFTNEQRDVAAEHAAIVDAVIARDADKAEELMAQHVQLTADLSAKAWQTRQGDASSAP